MIPPKLMMPPPEPALATDIHDRMPVFLTQEQFEPWLSGEAGAEYLKPAPNDYFATLAGIKAGQ
jgi:putative SOS response-associated peptidase YedK